MSVRNNRIFKELPFVILLLVFFLLSLGGCWNGSSEDARSGDLEITGMEILGEDNLQAGHPAKMQITVDATDITSKDAGIFFVLVPEDNLESSSAVSDEPECFNLGGTALGPLSPGENTYKVQLSIPAVVSEGSYYLAAIIDYADEYREFDEENNTFSLETIIVIGDEYCAHCNLVLKSFTVCNEEIYLWDEEDQSGYSDPEPGGNTINCIFEIANYGIDVHDIRLNASIENPEGGDYIPLSHWDSEQGIYTEDIIISAISADECMELYAELAIPMEVKDYFRDNNSIPLYITAELAPPETIPEYDNCQSYDCPTQGFDDNVATTTVRFSYLYFQGEESNLEPEVGSEGLALQASPYTFGTLSRLSYKNNRQQ